METAMRHRSHALMALLASACSAPQAAPPFPAPVPVPADGVLPAQAFASDLGELEAAIRERLAGEPGEYGIVVIDLETGRSLGVNDALAVHAASTMKVPVLLELYRRAAAGEIRLDGTVSVTNRFRSIADTSHYTLSPSDDSEQGLHAMVGGHTTYRDLARRMTVRSSNLATNLLVGVLNPDRIQETTDRVGGSGMRVLRGVEDGAAFRAGMNNTTTARGFANVLAAIARCDILPRTHCDEVIDILAAQEFNEMIPAGLPAGIRVAHKTGWITGIQHDGGIVYPLNSPPYVLVVLSRGGADTLAVRRVAADVSRITWDALGPGGRLRPTWAPRTAELLRLHAEWRLPAFPAPQLPSEEYWSAVDPVLAALPAFTVEEIGRSAEGRPLRLIRYGTGPERVLLWSQMHGDETTASRALADIFHYIAHNPDDERVRRWAERLTILAVPMLNPDGAGQHRRRSAFGIDVNRDARVLATPEGRALKAVQERWRPDFGFNLHDQNPRSRVGSSSRIAAIALLAPPPDAEATPTPTFVRARKLTAHIARELAPLTGRHLARYDDTYNPRAFGDGMQSWGVSTVLIETGSWRRDEPKHFLRAANFAALVSAFDAIADGSWEDVDPALYTGLPQNGRAVNDLIIRGGNIVLPDGTTYTADIAIDGAAVGGPAWTQITDIGDLRENEARDTLDATGLYVHLADMAPAPGVTAGPHPGQPPTLVLRRGIEPFSDAVWVVAGTAVHQLGSPDNDPPGLAGPFAGCYRIDPQGAADPPRSRTPPRSPAGAPEGDRAWSAAGEPALPERICLHWRQAVPLPGHPELLVTAPSGNLPDPYLTGIWYAIPGGRTRIELRGPDQGYILDVEPAGNDLAGTAHRYGRRSVSAVPPPVQAVRLRRD
jgi:beta-lactamase class A